MAERKTCSQCGACLNVCPVFCLDHCEESSPKAKLELISAGMEGEGSLSWSRMMDIANRCVGCGRCSRACPRHLSVAGELGLARARHPQWRQYLWSEWVRHGALFWKMAASLSGLAPVPLLPSHLADLCRSARAMTKPATGETWLKLVAGSAKPLNGRKFAIFSGCTANFVRPDWTARAHKAIAALGGRIIENVDFRCCGSTFAHAGMPELADRARRLNTRVWSECGRPEIVVFCASCLHSLHAYAESPIWETDGDRLGWSNALTPLSQLLVQGQCVAGSAVPSAIAYHSPCHWAGKDEDLVLLSKALPSLVKGEDGCCGFGGVTRMLNPGLATGLVRKRWQQLLRGSEIDADGQITVLSGCSGCILHLSAFSPKNANVRHWLDILTVQQEGRG